RDQALAAGEPALLGERVYTSRLIGRDPDLVLHGGGNTSVKIGDIIHIKGSGWDLGDIESPGLPAVQLAPLLAARHGKKLSDPEMVKLLRDNLIDPAAPNPSVEALLHAYIPHTFVDHSHASAILVLANQPNSRELCQEIYGDQVAWLPYVMPGYDLSIAAADLYDQHPDCHGLFLENHGLFTFAADGKTAYERMIAFVSAAEAYLEKYGISIEHVEPDPVKLPADLPGRLGQILREGDSPFADSLVLDPRCDDYLRAYTALDTLDELSQRGTITPDHVIRTKPWPLVIDEHDNDDTLRKKLADYIERYRAYFARHAPNQTEEKIMLDPWPRLVLVRGKAAIGLGKTAKEAGIVADLAAQTAKVILAAETLGRYTPIREDRLFEMEYWSLEQAKLKKA
ncbi:MAG: class II aldolase/adducin family protein, partial [Cardiobacteriaceae bacterium]|nr:class II aldolase/adducin family protein [Cardiobacteriaceae bacterium]